MKYAPAYLVYGRLPRKPIDMVFSSESTDQTVVEYAFHLHTRLTVACEQVKKHLFDAADKAKERLDAKARGQPYSVGDLVYLKRHVFTTGESKKFADRWLGPYTVEVVLGPVTYKIVCSASCHSTTANFKNLKRAFPGSQTDDLIHDSRSAAEDSESRPIDLSTKTSRADTTDDDILA